MLKGLLFFFVKIALSLRYSLEVKGWDLLSKDRLNPQSGILFLPNHTTAIDPIILLVVLSQKFKEVKPLVVENFYSPFRFFMDLVGAIPVPNFDVSANRWKLKKMEKVFQRVKQGLEKKENFLIYPSGRLKVNGDESLGGASLVPQLLETIPDVNIVLIRAIGLFGSKFSKAITGKTPDFWKTFLFGVKTVFKNGLFFTPRRKVLIEIAPAPEDFPRRVRSAINRYLEQWYNRYPANEKFQISEPLSLVSYSRWREDLPAIQLKERAVKKEVAVPDTVKAEIIQFLSKLSSLKPSKITPEMDLAKDLGLDSLETAELFVFLTERYDLHPIAPGALESVEDLFQAAVGEHNNGQEEVLATVSPWLEHKRSSPQLPEGKTIAEAFLRNCERMGGSIACIDRLSGSFTYKQLKRMAIVLSYSLKRVPGDKIGLLFPSSVPAYLLILACHFAKKVPVMLNWTTGSRALDAAVDLLKIETVISSSKFLDRISALDLGKLEELVVFLEEIKPMIPLKDKLRGLALSYKKPESIVRSLLLSDEEPAVILFTSGTESYPKAVPLSHSNLIENQRAALSCVHWSSEDILAGILPPFHSFGFSVTGLLPLLAGVKVFYAPDPTDSYSLVRDCREFTPTIFCAAPSFYKGLFRVAKKEDLKSLKLLVSGAEKMPSEFLEIVKQYGTEKVVLEGYGITECSPIITLNRETEPPRGVGYPLPGIELCLIHPETQALLLPQETGEICVFGPNVFNGYLGKAHDPFIAIEGKRWYRTGDLGHLDEKGALILSGRLKRFAKIGGEMISLTAIEEELEKAALKKGWIAKPSDLPILSVALKKSDRPQLLLFTIFKVDNEVINETLEEAGFSPLIKISETRLLEQIPLTGTGKTNYRLLDDQAI